jgi:protein kinase A
MTFSCILCKQVSPPYLPLTKGAGDASNFDTYDEEPLKVEAKDKFAKEFKNF